MSSAVTESPVPLNLAMMQGKPIPLEVASQSSTDTEDIRDVIHKVETQLEQAIAPVSKPEAVVLVDPWSTGNNVWRHLLSEGFKVIVLWENNLVRSSSLQAEAILMHYNLQDTVAKIRSLDVNVKAVLPGSETGVPLSEALGNAMNLPTHPASTAQARRNKYIMGETLRAKGVRAVKQIMTIDFEEAKAFVLKELVPMATSGLRVIVKPVMGAGSDDVYLCKSMEDFERKFKIVNGKINSLGLKNDAVLVQEFLEGIEYVLDSVSKHGIHRIVSIWQYDKREANDRFNIYHGSFPLVNDNETTRALVAYMLQVLEALEFKNGPSHAEIKITPTGPCLVEIGARCHGGGGAWMELATKVWGTNQIEVLSKGVRSTEDDDHFNVEFPTKMLHNGCVADMVLYEDGVIHGFPGVELVKDLPSMHEIVHYNKIGDRVIKTVDCNTQPGHFVLMHEDKEQVQKDFDTIHQIMRERRYFDIRP